MAGTHRTQWLTRGIDDALAPREARGAHPGVWKEASLARHLLSHPALSVVEARFPAGESESRHAHLRAQQFIYVLSGTLCVEMDRQMVECGASQWIHVPPATPHRFFNASSSDAIALVISSPMALGDRVELSDSDNIRRQRWV